MGFAPRQVDQMSIWEISVIFDAYAQAHGAKRRGRSMSDERMAELGIEGF
jgi:hypothetical protein